MLHHAQTRSCQLVELSRLFSSMYRKENLFSSMYRKESLFSSIYRKESLSHQCTERRAFSHQYTERRAFSHQCTERRAWERGYIKRQLRNRSQIGVNCRLDPITPAIYFQLNSHKLDFIIKHKMAVHSSCVDVASFPGPRPASRLTVLQVTGSWANAWERGYAKGMLNHLALSTSMRPQIAFVS